MKVVVGQGSCGIASGAAKTAAEFVRLIANAELPVRVEKTGCIGNCYLEPIVDIRGDDGTLLARYVRVQPGNVAEIVENHLKLGRVVQALAISDEDVKFLDSYPRIVLRNAGIIDPESIKAYLANDGYAAIRKVLGGMTQDEVIAEIKTSGLRGRGGAGFPTWFKWNAAKQNASDEKYMVCNADEGDPGAFMDRSVLEGDPHSVLEGMIIGGYAIGAKHGIIYVRAEYPLAIARLELAIKQAAERGYLGKNIL
ncbi:MAG: NADH-quinone oxidoreductase subunit F, partial [Oscillospiraceae bacterium]|nr:NADH-quinone oxidoreductase subunit F [Oscillospiraceae bacterium]